MHTVRKSTFLMRTMKSLVAVTMSILKNLVLHRLANAAVPTPGSPCSRQAAVTGFESHVMWNVIVKEAAQDAESG
jgi:hypothetical protein